MCIVEGLGESVEPMPQQCVNAIPLWMSDRHLPHCMLIPLFTFSRINGALTASAGIGVPRVGGCPRWMSNIKGSVESMPQHISIRGTSFLPIAAPCPLPQHMSIAGDTCFASVGRLC